MSTFDSDIYLGGITSLTEQTSICLPGSGTLPGSATFTGLGQTSTIDNTPNLGSSYNETIEYTINTNGIGIVGGSIAIAQAGGAVATPEPYALLFLGLGVDGLFLVGCKRRLALA